MMKRVFSVVIAAALLFGLMMSVAAVSQAAESPADKAVDTLMSIGLVKGYGDGLYHPEDKLTRAQFCALAVTAAGQADKTAGAAYRSLFTDVPSAHWALPCINLAYEKGWISGRGDGTFAPDEGVKVQEAVTVCLRLLGYTDSQIGPFWPEDYLSKARQVGLLDNTAAAGTDTLDRGQAALIIYNLLTCETPQGKYYAETLGYKVTDGALDLDAILEDQLEGPFVSDGGDPALSFVPAAVYKNGKKAALGDLNAYDVYYCNPSLKTLWIYSDKVSGAITGFTPSALSPSSVSVDGVSYPIGTASLKRQLSSLSGDRTGEYVTLLLGMDGSVVEALTGEAVNADYYGVVQEVKETVEQAQRRTQVIVFCTDGQKRTFTVPLTTACAERQKQGGF